MRRTGLITLFIVVVFAAHGVLACARNDHGVFEDINCAAGALTAADRELNAAYRDLLAKVSPEQKKLLIRSQRAWLQFVRDEAAFILSVEGDGSSGDLIVTNFREAEARMRAKQLRNWKIE